MANKNVVKGATYAVATAIMTASLALSDPLTVAAQTSNNAKYNTAKVIDYSDMYVPPKRDDGEGYSPSAPAIEVDAVSGPQPASPVQGVATQQTGFNLTGVWTYLANDANNPAPVLVDQGNNNWLLAVYQGTTVNLNFNGMQTGVVPQVLGVTNNFVATVGTENGIVIAANTVGIDAAIYNMNGTNVSVIISVVAPNPGAGVPGLITNATNVVPTTTPNTPVDNEAGEGYDGGSTITTESVAQNQDKAYQAQEFIRLLNAERAKLGRQPLSVYGEFQSIAERRAVEIYSDFRHNGTGSVEDNTITSSECITTCGTASSAIAAFKKSFRHWNTMTFEEDTWIGVSFYKNRCCVITGHRLSQDAIDEIEDDNADWNIAYD